MRERDIFIAALERMDTANQTAYLAEVCGDDIELRNRVSLLLEQHSKHEDFILDRAAMVDPEQTSDTKPGQLIGRYKLIEKLGEGGFGEVWLGEQERPVRRTVAIKVIKLGMDTKQVIARFEGERQALALMNHPNIATVLDVGTTEAGRPFFVMELVRGVPITEYCDAESLDTRQRLDLFATVCRAVQHAHQRGVIHRDLKPSNILVAVDDGVATIKVIDFGIAKATNAEHSEHTHLTEDRQIVGTPVYMSPEQAKMGNRDIDTRCDVYSLGVLLYELLTGTTPFDSAMLREAGYGEMLRIIREDEPKKPSTRVSTLGASANVVAQRRGSDIRKLGILFRGDLDWIVMRCLEKDRNRRYASAKELSDEIVRHMHDEPVNAGPPSTGYRLQKFVRRNRGAVAAAAIVMATITAGIVGTSIGMVRALDAKREAEASRAIAETRADETALLANFHSAMLRDANLEELGKRIAAKYVGHFRRAVEENPSVLDQAGRIPGVKSNEVVRAFERHLAMVNGADVAKVVIGDYILAPAAAAASQQFAEKPLLEASIRHAIGQNYAAAGLYEEAEVHLLWALETRKRELPPENIHIAESAHVVAGVLFQRGKYELAEELLRMVNDSCEFTTASKDRELKAEIVAGLGAIEGQRGNYDAAEKLLREGLKVVPLDSPQRPNLLSSLAGVYFRRLDFVNAEALLREAVEARTQPEYVADQLRDLAGLGTLQRHLGKKTEAERTLREALKRAREVLGDRHPSVAIPAISLGELLIDGGDFTQAELLLNEALDIVREAQGRIHPEAASALSSLGVLYSRTGRYAEAETSFRDTIAIRKELFGESDPKLFKPRIGLASALVRQERFNEAEKLLLELGGDNSGSARDDKLRRTARQELVRLYEAWHKKNPSEGYDAKAKKMQDGNAAQMLPPKRIDD